MNHYDVFRVAGSAAPAAWDEPRKPIASVPASATSYDDAPAALFVSNLQEDPRPLSPYLYAVAAVDVWGQRGPASAVPVTTPGAAIASDDFQAQGIMPWWFVRYGSWQAGGGLLRQTSTAGCGGITMADGRGLDDARAGNFVTETQVRIDDTGGNDANWAGIMIARRTSPTTSGTAATWSTCAATARCICTRTTAGTWRARPSRRRPRARSTPCAWRDTARTSWCSSTA